MAQWYELFDREHEPTADQVTEFINTPLFGALDGYLRETYKVKPRLSYSGCGMDGGAWKGWNIKYPKSGKSLCTLYPKQGYLHLLVTIGERGVNEAELLMPLCTDYIKNLFANSGSQSSKYLGIELRGDDVLNDVKRLIDIRARTK